MKKLFFVVGLCCLMNIVNGMHPVDQRLIEIEEALNDIVHDIATFNLQSFCLLDQAFIHLGASPHSNTRIILKNRLIRFLNNTYSINTLDSGLGLLNLNQLAFLVAIKEQIRQRDVDNGFYINQGYREDFRTIKKFLSEEECSTIAFIEHS